MKRFPRTILSDALSGLARDYDSAAAAFEAAPTNETARRYRVGTLVAFLVASGMLLAAALFETALGNRSLSELFGWFGVLALGASLISALSYSGVNKPVELGDQDFS